MEVKKMKHNHAIQISRLFIFLFSIAFAGMSAAHGDHDGDRHGDRIATKWMIEDAINVYNVDAPANPPLSYVKKRFMARTGLPVRFADYYLVEKLTSTTTSVPTRDPNCLPPCIPVFSPVTVTDYEPLDDSMSLKELGVVDGDTLRVRQMPDVDLSAVDPHDRDFHGHGRHHGDHHDGGHHH